MGTVFNIEQKSSDSPYIAAIWRNHCEGGGPFISMATSNWEIVVTRLNGETTLTVRGPETHATPAYCPPGAEHFGVCLSIGVSLTGLPASALRDSAINLPRASGDSFWLGDAEWQYPDFETLDLFADRLVRSGLLVREPAVEAALHGEVNEMSIRSVQRRFLRAAGLTHGAVSQIERARHATILLKEGTPILDTVDRAGYSDQPHLTRSLKYYIGQTPAQLTRENGSPQLSFLFKTPSMA